MSSLLLVYSRFDQCLGVASRYYSLKSCLTLLRSNDLLLLIVELSPSDPHMSVYSCSDSISLTERCGLMTGSDASLKYSCPYKFFSLSTKVHMVWTIYVSCKSAISSYAFIRRWNKTSWSLNFSYSFINMAVSFLWINTRVFCSIGLPYLMKTLSINSATHSHMKTAKLAKIMTAMLRRSWDIEASSSPPSSLNRCNMLDSQPILAAVMKVTWCHSIS